MDNQPQPPCTPGAPTSAEALDALIETVMTQVIAWPAARQRLLSRMAGDASVAHEMRCVLSDEAGWRDVVFRLCQAHPSEMAALVEEYAGRALRLQSGVSRPWGEPGHPGSMSLLTRVMSM